MLGLGGLDALKLPGLTPAMAAASAASITGLAYNATTGVLSGTAPSNATVLVSVSGAYVGSVVAASNGAWSLNVGTASVVRTATAVAAPATAFSLAASPVMTTWNPNDKTSYAALSNNNLTVTVSSAPYRGARSTTSQSSGKLYAELTMLVNGAIFGIGTASQDLEHISSGSANFAFALLTGSASSVTNVSNTTTAGANGTYPAGTVIGMAADLDAGSATFTRNGVAIAGAITIPTTHPLFLIAGSNGSSGNGGTLNTGQSAFAYTPPAGYSAWG